MAAPFPFIRGSLHPRLRDAAPGVRYSALLAVPFTLVGAPAAA